MKVSVYDTYVPKGSTIMHFDILVKDGEDVENVHKYGKEYLKTKGINDFELSTRECRFCHMENALEPVEKSILEKGYFIIEMQNC